MFRVWVPPALMLRGWERIACRSCSFCQQNTTACRLIKGQVLWTSVAPDRDRPQARKILFQKTRLIVSCGSRFITPVEESAARVALHPLRPPASRRRIQLAQRSQIRTPNERLHAAFIRLLPSREAKRNGCFTAGDINRFFPRLAPYPASVVQRRCAGQCVQRFVQHLHDSALVSRCPRFDAAIMHPHAVIQKLCFRYGHGVLSTPSPGEGGLQPLIRPLALGQSSSFTTHNSESSDPKGSGRSSCSLRTTQGMSARPNMLLNRDNSRASREEKIHFIMRINHRASGRRRTLITREEQAAGPTPRRGVASGSLRRWRA